jgi:hypothetical protein
MHRHPYFDLWLHDDEELTTLLGNPLVERTTLHEWPLSCVQRLRIAEGRTLVYKAQAEPTVEPAFYSHARSPLLASAQVIGGASAPAALLLEHIPAPRLSELRLTEEEALHIGREVLEQIGRIAGELPAVVDVRTEERWSGYFRTVRADLQALVDAGTFRQVDQVLIDRLARHAESPQVLAAVRSRPGYVHGDLWGDNIFVSADGYKVIDWQRPIWGPVDLDLASLLESLGFDPIRHIAPEVVQMMYLLRIGWLAGCARRWFPPGAQTYDEEIVRLAAQVDRLGEIARG